MNSPLLVSYKIQPGFELETCMIKDPVDVYTFCLEAVHKVTGLPWWVVVPATAFVVRASVGRSMLQYHRRAQNRFLGPLATKLGANMQSLSHVLESPSSTSEKLRAITLWFQGRREILAGCEAGHFRRNAMVYAFIGMQITQIWGIRHAFDIDPSFAVEGTLWFPSLAQHDPWARLPLIHFAMAWWAIGPRPSREEGIGAALHFWSQRAWTVAMVPWLVFLEFPNGIVLHFLGAAVYRLINRWWSGPRSTTGGKGKTNVEAKGKNLIWDREK
jgi:hypothetical protein